MPRERPRASDRINLPKTKADDFFDSVEVKPASQPVNKSTSQPAENLKSYKASKSTSQLPEQAKEECDKLTSQQPSQSASQSIMVAEEVVTSWQPDQPVAATGEIPISQPAIVTKEPVTSQQSSQSIRQQPDKLRKATFKLSSDVLDKLDYFHLRLQLELGKVNTPYKEIVVEEAIAQLLEQAAQDRDGLLRKLQARQQQNRQ